MTRLAFVAFAFAAATTVACSNTVDGQDPVPAPTERTDSAQTAQGTQSSSQGSSSSSTTTKKSTTCPEIDVPACSSTEELVTGVDEDGCSYAYCKPNACPPVDVPQCAPGETLKYTTDESGCSFAHCE